MIAPSQADLTIIQKLFLMKAVPLVREEQEKEQEKNRNNTNTNSIKDRVRQKKRSMS